MSLRHSGRTAALLALAILAGCQTPPFDDPARLGPFFVPVNHVGEPGLPSDLRRVVLLPVCGGVVADAEAAAMFDPVFATELQKQNRFEVVVLTRSECRRRFGAAEFSSTAALPHDFLARLRRDFAADAVLWVDLTTYRPYGPLALGVRAKLATISEPRMLWSFDNIFSADNPAVANSARRHFIGQTHTAVPADLSPAVLQSPTRFATYVAAATFATLPPVASRATTPAPR